MTSLRLAGIPIDHILAEVATFPLASEAALAHHPTLLHPGLESATGALWREAEQHLLGCFPAFGLDELIAIRDRLWFAQGGAAPMALEQYLRRLAEWFL